MSLETVRIDSHGEQLAADLHLPAGPPRGVVVTLGPLTSVRTQASGAYAGALAERGFAGVAIDPRHFGDSTGAPRLLVDPARQVEDLRAALDWAAVEPRLAGLPAYLLGVCFGAGPAAVATAADERVRALAGVAGVYSPGGDPHDDGVARSLERGRAAWAAFEADGSTETVPAVADPDGPDAQAEVAMPLAEAFAYYGTERGARPGYVNGFAVASWAHTPVFDPASAAGRIGVPVALVHSEQALVPAWAHDFAAGLAQVEQTWLTSQGQIDFYDDPALVAAAADAAASVFAAAG